MKVFRHSGRMMKEGYRVRSFAYIKANWFERRAIRKRLDNRIVEAPYSFGPRQVGAQFIVTAYDQRSES